MKIKKKFLTILYLFLFFNFFGCVSTHHTTAPIWIKEFGTKTFSKDGIEGIGFASYDPKKRDSYRVARDNAYNEAMKNLTIKLKTQVKGTVERQLKDTLSIVGKKYKEESQEVLDSITQVMFDSVLGRKMFEEYQDKKNKQWWVFVWMTKEEVEKTIQEELQKQEQKNKSILKSCLELRKSANEYFSGNDTKIVTIIGIYENILSQLEQIKGIVVVDGMDNISLKSEIANNISILLNSLRIKPLDKTELDFILNQNIDTSLSAKVITNYKNKEYNVSFFPLKIDVVKGDLNIDKLTKTDETGIFSYKIYNITEEKNSADYLITVEYSVEYLGDKITLPTGQEMNFGEIYSGTVNVELKELKTNQIVASKNFVGLKGFGKTKKEAENNTLKKLSYSAAEYLISNW